MANLSCPSIDHRFLSPNGFLFTIERLPKVSFFTKDINLPSLSLQNLEQQTTLGRIEIPSDKLDFEQLTLNFLVDEKLDNWIEVFKWMQGLGFPENYQQYTIENNRRGNLSLLPNEADLPKNYSDAKLFILGSNNVVTRTVNFVDCFPIALGGIQFDSQNIDVPYVISSLTLEYSYYTIE